MNSLKLIDSPVAFEAVDGVDLEDSCKTKHNMT